MTETLKRPTVESGERHQIAADAFLYAAFIVLVAFGGQALVAYLISGGEPETLTTAPLWLELVGALAMPLAVIGGPLLAWRVHGRAFGWRELIAAVVGAVVGSALLGTAVVALVSVLRVLPDVYPSEEGPWDLVVIVTVAVVVFLARPVFTAVRDLAGSKRHPVPDWLRLATLAIGVAAVIVSVIAGGESAELGLFLAMPATAAACAAVATDLWQARQVRTGPHQDAAS